LAASDHATGRRLYDAICEGGAHAAGRDTGQIAAGKWADLMALDAGHIDLADQSGDTLLDCFIFAGDDHMIRDVWSAGRHMVQDGKHIHRAQITTAYRTALKPLRDSL